MIRNQSSFKFLQDSDSETFTEAEQPRNAHTFSWLRCQS